MLYVFVCFCLLIVSAEMSLLFLVCVIFLSLYIQQSWNVGRSSVETYYSMPSSMLCRAGLCLRPKYVLSQEMQGRSYV